MNAPDGSSNDDFDCSRRLLIARDTLRRICLRLKDENSDKSNCVCDITCTGLYNRRLAVL